MLNSFFSKKTKIKIERSLFHVESVEKAEPNRNLCWTLEVGTTPLDSTVPQKQIIYKLKMKKERKKGEVL